MHKSSKEELKHWDDVLDEYENSIGLPSYKNDVLPESELNEYLTMNRDTLEKLGPEALRTPARVDVSTIINLRYSTDDASSPPVEPSYAHRPFHGEPSCHPAEGPNGYPDYHILYASLVPLKPTHHRITSG